MNNKRFFLTLLLGLVMVLALVVPVSSQEPEVGGTMVFGLSFDPDTLDAQRSSLGTTVLGYLGDTLISRDPITGEFAPNLAESWTISDDGLTYEFVLRQDVLFHDGTPLTAADYAWTFQRALNPETASVVAGSVLLGVTGAQAVDEYTLQLTLAMPNFYLLDGLLRPELQPLSQAAVEAAGDNYGRQPVGVGPFRFVEWRTGDAVVLERNPDYVWGPAFTDGEPPFIETLEFRIIPNYSTVLPAIQSGEIDYSYVQVADLSFVEDLGTFETFSFIQQGTGNMVLMNLTDPKFSDVRVRQALNYAVDRDIHIQVAGEGQGMVIYGALSESTFGYLDGLEEIGYTYDLDLARSLMEDAGYTLNGDGFYALDGEVLSIDLAIGTSGPQAIVGNILQQQWGDLGVEVELVQQEPGVAVSNLISGNFEMSVLAMGWPNAGLLFGMFNTNSIGATNYSQLSDPDLDPLLLGMVFTADAAQNAQLSAAAQQYVVQQAYLVPIYASSNFNVLSTRIEGAIFAENAGGVLYLHDAYILGD